MSVAATFGLPYLALREKHVFRFKSGHFPAESPPAEPGRAFGGMTSAHESPRGTPYVPEWLEESTERVPGTTVIAIVVTSFGRLISFCSSESRITTPLSSKGSPVW